MPSYFLSFVKISFKYLLVLCVNKCLCQNSQIHSTIMVTFSAYFNGHVTCITIATVKIKLMPDLCTWTIVLIWQIEENGKKQLLVLGLIGAGEGGGWSKKAPLCTYLFRAHLSLGRKKYNLGARVTPATLSISL